MLLGKVHNAVHGIPTVHGLLGNNSHNSPWIVHVTTGDRKDAGTNATVWIKLGDAKDNWTKEIKLTQIGVDNYERGQVDQFPLQDSDVPSNLGSMEKIEVWRDSFGANDSWFLDVITVQNIYTGKEYYFPAQRWIKANKRHFFRRFDASLPQFEEYQQQRKDELVEKKAEYEYLIRPPGKPSSGLPAQVKELPQDETFSDSYKFEFIGLNKVKYMADKHLIALTTGGVKDKWDSLEDLNNMYKYSMPLPGSERHWKSDVWFGQQRLQGANPILIRLCMAPPPNLPVDEERIKAILDGSTLAEAIAQNRIFVIDLKIVAKLPITEDRQVCAPVALFYLDKERKNLLPLCIQLNQTPGEKNPIFYPTDEPNAWLLAKMWYNNADATYHQSCSHLGLTHLQMEGIAVCMHRNLSPSHPLFKLLAPHFLYLLAINSLGLAKLISPGGWVDKTMSIGCDGMFELIHRGAELWRMDVTAIPPVDCKARGVDDPAVLPNYPYRDDAIAIYNVIRTYVATIAKFYYDTPEKVEKDEELQNFARELVLPREKGGVGIHGVPMSDGKFKTVEEIITTMSAIISTCSVTHAAVNFNQYDEYGFPPNYPTRMTGTAPTTKEGFTDADVVKQLPSKATTLDIMIITRLLSSRGTKSLGDFEVKYLYDPVSVQAAKKLRRELEEISENIKARNEAAMTAFPYQWLDPEFVPNAISI